MSINRNKTDRVPITTPKDLTKEIDAYKQVKKYSSRSRAIQELVKLGLESEYERHPGMKNDIQLVLDQSIED
ncbi:CopG family ribbon-helix-helix protein [Enterococcus sp. AZ163]|uniref:CopG family ribbon-helix-helix protein n=1 Tax=Enterococcus sp. AZ163 TaxID=2774638 RepID=UPI003D26FAA1